MEIVTLTEFILREEQKIPGATGSFTILLTQIENAVKIIGSHVRRNGLVDMMGTTGKRNAYADEVQKLDEFSNATLVRLLTESRQVYTIASEELEKPIYTSHKKAHYNVFIDPLDGSSNIDTSITIGTIFSIYRNTGRLLQQGKEQVAAGYIVYGTNCMFVYTSKNGVHGFTFDPLVGSFFLTHPHMRIPEEGSIYSINEAYDSQYDESVRRYLSEMKSKEKTKARYTGSMIADIHRTILKGGIFLYPATVRKPAGHLRLLFEVNPFSLIVEEAGGLATTGDRDPLEILPKSVEDKSPVFMGSKRNISDYLANKLHKK